MNRLVPGWLSAPRLDLPLLAALLLIMGVGLVVLYRASGQSETLLIKQLVRLGVAAVLGQYTTWSGNFLDIDNDGWLDIFKTHFMDDTPVLYRAMGDGTFSDATGPAGLGDLSQYVSCGAAFTDYDNDGYLDAFTSWAVFSVNGYHPRKSS